MNGRVLHTFTFPGRPRLTSLCLWWSTWKDSPNTISCKWTCDAFIWYCLFTTPIYYFHLGPARLPQTFLEMLNHLCCWCFILWVGSWRNTEYKAESWTVANEQNWHYLILWETFCKYSLSEINKFKLKDLSEVTSWNARNTTRAIWSKVQKVCSFLKTKYQIIWCRLFISKFRRVVIPDPLSPLFSQNSRCHRDF